LALSVTIGLFIKECVLSVTKLNMMSQASLVMLCQIIKVESHVREVI